jgi:hypothetical protein
MARLKEAYLIFELEVLTRIRPRLKSILPTVQISVPEMLQFAEIEKIKKNIFFQ